MLTINTLGNLTIQINGSSPCRLGSRKAEAILVYIALRGGQQNRIQLASLFWPESAEKYAQTSLRTALSILRKNIGDYLIITHETIGIKDGSNLRLDVNEIKKYISRGDVIKAVELYRGDFLSGFLIKDSSEFETWRRMEQERIKGQIIRSLQSLLRNKLAVRDFQSGQDIAQKIINIDPLDEIAYQQYMLALVLQGKRSAALEQYQKCTEILVEELGAFPCKETRQIHQLIQNENIPELIRYLEKGGNLPNPLTTFLGREIEIGWIIKTLQDENCRLVTLTGFGGSGKTRLAIKAASNLFHHFSNGVFFIPLEQITSSDFLISAFAEAIQFRFDSMITSFDPVDQLFDFLKNRSVLFIIDGFEHLMKWVGFLSKLLAQTNRVKLLVTSRQKLNISGEWNYHLSGLPIPQAEEQDKQDTVSSLDLFIERASQNNPGVSFSVEERESIIRICQLVEGLPLGIELAASWTSVLNCSEIAEEIELNMGFLSVSSGDPSKKHYSLQAIFNQSWELLDDQQKKAMSVLSVFRGGFDRYFAEHGVGVNLDQLTSLVNRSLIYRTEKNRFDMHRAIHQFSIEKLKEDPCVWQEVHQKHCCYFTEFLLEREDGLNGSDMIASRAEVRQELGNIRDAVKWALTNWELEKAQKVLSSFISFCLVHGWHESVVELEHFANTLQNGNKERDLYENPLYLSCRANQAYFMTNLGMTKESDTISQNCLESSKTPGMNMEYALCLHNLGVNAEFRGDYNHSRELLEKSIRIGKKSHSILFPSFYLWLGYVYFLLGEYDRGMSSFKVSYDLYSKVGHLLGIGFSLSKMGLALDGLGQHLPAMEYHQKALQIFRDTGDYVGQGYSLSRICIGSNLLRNFREANRVGLDSLDLFSKIGHRWGKNAVSCHLGFTNIGLNKLKAAKCYFTDALNETSEYGMVPLCLYAISGFAVILKKEGNKKTALDYFKYIQTHPKTPAIYITQARYFFQDCRDSFIDKKGSEEKIPAVNEIIQSLMQLI